MGLNNFGAKPTNLSVQFFHFVFLTNFNEQSLIILPYLAESPRGLDPTLAMGSVHYRAQETAKENFLAKIRYSMDS